MRKILLRNGLVAELRKIKNSKQEKKRLRSLFDRATFESLYRRFFIAFNEIPEDMLEKMIQTDEKRALSIVCEIDKNIIGIGSYWKTQEGGVAEVSFFVDDAYQGLGVGSILLNQLAYIAWINGFNCFEAYVMRDNIKMIKVFKNSGFEIKQEWEGNDVHFILPLYETERAKSLAEMREKHATSASIAPFFKPCNILLFDNVDIEKDLAFTIRSNIKNSNFIINLTVNPEELTEEKEFDIVVINQVDEEVLNILKSNKIKTRGIIALGIYYSIDEKMYNALSKKLLDISRKKGARVIGPHSLGIINSEDSFAFNISYLSALPKYGSLSIASHAGALGLYLVKYFDNLGIGINNFVSLGNKVDVSGNDLLQYWEDDMNTEAIILYLESLGNPIKFTKLCRRISRIKPIFVVKTAKNPLSAAMSGQKKVEFALNDYTISNLFKQAGVIRVDTVEELCETVKLFYSAKIPENDRIAILSNTIEGSIVMTDALRERGAFNIQKTEIVPLNEKIEEYKKSLKLMLSNEHIDIIIILYMPLLNDYTNELIELLSKELQFKSEKLVILCLFDKSKNIPEYILIGDTGKRIPVYSSPEKIASSLTYLIDYFQYTKRPKGNVPDIKGYNTCNIRNFVKQKLSIGKQHLNTKEQNELLKLMGIAKANVELMTDVTGKMVLYIVKDPYFGPLIVVNLNLNDKNDLSEKYFFEKEHERHISAIRLTPLTDVEAEDMVNTLFKHHHYLKKLKEELIMLFLKFSRLPAEVPEISKIIIRNIIIGKEGYTLKDMTVNISDPEIKL